MRRWDWATLALCAALISACGPNAAPVTLEVAASTPTAERGVTPVAWRVEPTPTPGRPTAPPPPTATARPAPTIAPRPATPADTTRTQAPDWRATVPPTIEPPRAPLPTPTPEPPLQCQFDDRTISIPPAYAPGPGITPGVVPPYYRGAPGYITFAAGEPLPGVFLELRLPRTSFVAGAVIQPEIQVRNTTAAGVRAASAVAAVPDGQPEAGTPAQADPRSFPSLRRGPGFGGPIVPGGQTWSIPSIVQLPFDAAEPVHLDARVGLSLASSPTQIGTSPRLMTDLPLHLTAAAPAQELHLELHADHRQWCLRATDARGGTPTGPLLVRMTARSPSTYSERGASSAGIAATWAARWTPNTVPNNVPLWVSFWVGGPDYVTAVVQQTLAAGP